MASTITATQSNRVGNEAGVTGSSSFTAEVAPILEQTVSAGTEEEVTSSFADHTLQSAAMSCDQDAVVQALSTRYAITGGVAGPPGTIITGGDDLTGIVFPGDLVRIEGSTGVDGVYQVETVTAVAGGTITLANGMNIVGAPGDGTVARVASAGPTSYSYPIATSVLLTDVLTITGDVTDIFAAGDFVSITGSTGDDAFREIDTVVEAAGVTTITLVAGGVITNNGDGQVSLFQAGIPLTANEPYMWLRESGQQNPFRRQPLATATEPAAGLYNAARGRVASLMVSVPGATNGNFKGRMCSNSNIFP